MTTESSPNLDTTRSWVDTHRVNGTVQPSLLVRYATDTNFQQGSDKAIMNLGLPGMRLPNLTTWQVTEQADQLVQEATITMLNCMLVSKVKTTLTASLPGRSHGPTIVSQWTQSPKAGDEGGIYQHDGNFPISHFSALPTPDFPSGIPYDESDIVFRLFGVDNFTVASTAGFPNPAIPQDDDNDVADISYYASSSSGVGSYFVMIDQEIVRVVNLSGSTFSIPPGGRGIAGTAIVAHSSGAPVTLLNYGPYTGDWVGMGYLNVDDYQPQTAICRVGTCLTSYEGYGPINGPLSHAVDHGRNYVFTGYWFVTTVEPSLQSDGTPVMTLTLSSSAHMVDAQKVNPILFARMGSLMQSWTNSVWGLADYKRQVPRQWISWSAWDPSLINAYPLTISVEFAQNKDFLEHVQSTQFGLNCEICRSDVADWMKAHGISGSLGAAVEPQKVEGENRVIGMHIYKESIRVNRDAAGPLKTYIALMAIIAMSSWDHPALGTQLSQLFTKIPNKLHDALSNIHTGLCFNGQLSIDIDGSDPANQGVSNSSYPWFSPGYSDEFVISSRDPLLCPFKSQYDQVPFTQPMQDLADTNGASLWFTREGYPVFVPMFFNFRPNGKGFKTYSGFQTQDGAQILPSVSGEWHMAYGGSISQYSSSVNMDQIFSVAMATGTLPFDGSTIQVFGGGTGLVNGKRMMYSPLGGNQDALAMTSGVTQTTSVSLDNVMLGLSWDTNPASWGVKQQIEDPGKAPGSITSDSGNIYVLNGKPPLYNGQVSMGNSNAGDGHGHTYQSNANAAPGRVKDIQQTINFFQVRRYVSFVYKGKLQYGISEDGKFGNETKIALINLCDYLKGYGYTTIRHDGIYDQGVYNAINDYLNKNALYIQTDIWWYAFNGDSFDEYVAAVTGVPVKFNSNLDTTPGSYAVDDTGTQQKVADWANSHFSKPLVNIANRTVDDSINKAVVRSVECSMADPRVIPGDTIWLNIPGYLGSQTSPPYTNGLYVLQATRSMDLQQGTYTATYSGCRYIADHNSSYQYRALNGAYDFLTQAGDQ